MKIALICGGPSPERGISLNSARSVLDHLTSDDIAIVPFYFNLKKEIFKISPAQLYSNTPSDFDFKLKQTSAPLSRQSLIRALKKAEIVFPVIHGIYGEDGGIQKFLEENNIPFIGSGSNTCRQVFDKFIANETIKKNGFFALPSVVIEKNRDRHRQIITEFFKANHIKRAVVKPANGGSSIGVFSVSTPRQALNRARFLFSQKIYDRLVIEPFAQGKEFTIIILENRFGLPVALPPTEIETDYTKHQIFDYRKKYLPTRQVIWHCPPRFNDKLIEKIEAQAEQLFALFQMRDFARFDGWILPNGQVWFCDFNPISGLEQNSFLFQQASRIGYTHADILRHILANACQRYRLKFQDSRQLKPSKRKKVNIIFGSSTSERQVSLMTGTNVWLKLRSSKLYEPHPFLLDKKGYIWKLPYHLALNHTVEEIAANCLNYNLAEKRLESFEKRVRIRLGINDRKNNEFFAPEKMTLNKFIQRSDFVFNALHGGQGEDGTWQKLLASHHVKFNGPDAKVSKLCLDKQATARFIKDLKIGGIKPIPQKIIKTQKILLLKNTELKNLWQSLKNELKAKTLIVKPSADGCSSGVVHLYSVNELKKYRQMLVAKKPFIPKKMFSHQNNIIEMPPLIPTHLLFEKFIETDSLRVKDNKLKRNLKTGWIEITVGVIQKKKEIIVFNPSITITEGEVLTVEEKFQGGTGVNITPPPNSLIKSKQIEKIKSLIGRVARKIGIQGYCRIDAFANIKNGDLMIIEINTLPALTPSTVLYQQALAENPPIFPRKLLELLIINKNY